MERTTVRRMIEAARAAGMGVRRRGFPPDVQNSVRTYTEQRTAHGVAMSAVAGELGLATSTLDGWMRRTRDETSIVPAFRRVEVVETVRDAPAIIVHAPGGLRIEGLDVQELAELLRRLA